jgi:hypothetical protein
MKAVHRPKWKMITIKALEYFVPTVRWLNTTGVNVKNRANMKSHSRFVSVSRARLINGGRDQGAGEMDHTGEVVGKCS